MKFRNYVPQDKHLQEGKLAPAVLPKFEDPVATAPSPEQEVIAFVSIWNKGKKNQTPKVRMTSEHAQAARGLEFLKKVKALHKIFD
ncbi:hypothetical protein K1719_033909 [Acacia pycnantha]|nr:hypothetical protein K1719_033909 [Acacia pycnantha]